jgi:N-acetylglucosaminyldiphosphoundecaprenol N-acetyl-beta-D-mannosaminyltransferase
MKDEASEETRRYQILEIGFDLISFETVIRTIGRWRRNRERQYIAAAPPHSVLLCHRDKQVKRAMERAGLVVPDGVGIIMAARLLGYPHFGRVAGPELMLKLADCGRRHGYRHFFYGGAENVAGRLARRLSAMYPGLKVAGTYCPPFGEITEEQDREIVRTINAAQPDVVWVGLGAPKQEKWMEAHLGSIDATAMIGVGAAFDFHSENVKWSPAWVRKLGIEWAYRLAQNPARMWRRNIDSPLFLSKVLWQRLTMISRNGSQMKTERPCSHTGMSRKTITDDQL